MSKQEGFIDGIADILFKNRCFYKLSDKDVSKLIIKYLSDAGVVIRIEKMLPENIYGDTLKYKETREGEWIERFVYKDDNSNIDVYWGYRKAQQDMLDTGYVAVEPLIEEKIDEIQET